MGKVKDWMMEVNEKIINDLRESIAFDYGLHLDDDCSEIEDILVDEVQGTELEELLQ